MKGGNLKYWGIIIANQKNLEALGELLPGPVYALVPFMSFFRALIPIEKFFSAENGKKWTGDDNKIWEKTFRFQPKSNWISDRQQFGTDSLHHPKLKNQ